VGVAALELEREGDSRIHELHGPAHRDGLEVGRHPAPQRAQVALVCSGIDVAALVVRQALREAGGAVRIARLVAVVGMGGGRQLQAVLRRPLAHAYGFAPAAVAAGREAGRRRECRRCAGDQHRHPGQGRRAGPGHLVEEGAPPHLLRLHLA
jgi:hypothetical protein